MEVRQSVVKKEGMVKHIQSKSIKKDKGAKNRWNIQKTTSKMVDFKLKSIILSVSGLNISIKTLRLFRFYIKKDPTKCYL